MVGEGLDEGRVIGPRTSWAWARVVSKRAGERAGGQRHRIHRRRAGAVTACSLVRSRDYIIQKGLKAGGIYARFGFRYIVAKTAF